MLSMPFLLKVTTEAKFAIVAVNDLGLTHSYSAGPEAYDLLSHELFDDWDIGRCAIKDCSLSSGLL
jgi:hypothetical protein